MLSWLTRGRALLDVGVGHLPADFELYDVERGTRFDRIRDLLDVVGAAWSGEPFDVTGTHGRWRGHVTPAPFGGKRPEVVMGAHGPRGLELTGQRADLWLSDPQRHVDVVARLAGRVRSAAEAAGRQVRIGMFRDGWIGDSREACERLWLPHALAVHRLYFNVGVYLEDFEPWSGRSGPARTSPPNWWPRAGCSTATARTCGPRSPTGGSGPGWSTWPCGCGNPAGRVTRRR
jgi:alkanesulfonate monooxygenase SsuD/methylene tetrahydromethanopterin reductase-like flavin-dependent oxidoreductase (luciferase family)